MQSPIAVRFWPLITENQRAPILRLPVRHRLSSRLAWLPILAGAFATLWILHYPLLRLPYLWDEAGYYIPAALDFSREWRLIPRNTLPSGHTPFLMIYLGLAWRVFGFSPLATRTAMILIAAAQVTAIYFLGRRVVPGPRGLEIAVWSASLLALSPMFFAQSSLAHLDLAAGLATTLAVLALLGEDLSAFALAASLAVLSKETAIVLLPAAWLLTWRGDRKPRAAGPLHPRTWLLLPLLPLLLWMFYYHRVTGYWIGNGEYLEYNVYSRLSLLRFFTTLPRRLYQLLIGGFNGLLVLGALSGFWWKRKRGIASGNGPVREEGTEGGSFFYESTDRLRDFYGLALTLCAAYVLMLSVLGGAVLPRYLLPVFPLFFVAAVVAIWQLPKNCARALCAAIVACMIGGWFLNPAWAFPFEDNLSYADFIGLHQQAARFLETEAPKARVLTAWPASDEISKPFLGYVQTPLRAVPVGGFTQEDFTPVTSDSFDVLYLYSHKWKLPDSALSRFIASGKAMKFQRRYFDVVPPVSEPWLISRYRLRLLKEFERRGQWVRIYAQEDSKPPL